MENVRWSLGAAMLSGFVVGAVASDSVWGGLVIGLLVGVAELLYIRWRKLDE